MLHYATNGAVSEALKKNRQAARHQRQTGDDSGGKILSE